MTNLGKSGGGAFSPMTISDADFTKLVRFVQTNYGIDLSQKRQLITGRLSASIRQKGYSTNYTFFMREQDHLDYFRKTIIPDIVRRHQKDKTLAIWSAGCSSGEEPYNISMYLFDYLGADARNWDTRLLATDISSKALASARRGVYELPDTIPADWKKKYFVPQSGGRYSVAPAVKDNVIFQTFNLMDPIKFRRKFDVIFCRNVMIYFDQPTKDALVQRFYDATVPGGYLLISYSENLSQNTPYRRLATATFQK